MDRDTAPVMSAVVIATSGQNPDFSSQAMVSVALVTHGNTPKG